MRYLSRRCRNVLIVSVLIGPLNIISLRLVNQLAHVFAQPRTECFSSHLGGCATAGNSNLSQDHYVLRDCIMMQITGILVGGLLIFLQIDTLPVRAFCSSLDHLE